MREFQVEQIVSELTSYSANVEEETQRPSTVVGRVTALILGTAIVFHQLRENHTRPQ